MIFETVILLLARLLSLAVVAVVAYVFASPTKPIRDQEAPFSASFEIQEPVNALDY